MPSPLEVHPLVTPATRPAADALALRHWGGTRVLDVAGVYESLAPPRRRRPPRRQLRRRRHLVPRGRTSCRIVTLASAVEGQGVGRALLAAAEAEARAAGAARLVVSTTNNNLRALALYQRNGYRLAALHPGAIDAFRRLKPQIPETDPTGIPIRDMIELEKPLG